MCFFSFLTKCGKNTTSLCAGKLFMKAYQFKAGNSQRGDEWKNIASDLFEAKEVTFQRSIAAVFR